MKKHLITSFSAVISASLLILIYVGCDKVDAPYLEHTQTYLDTAQTSDTTYKKIVLLEDFTGHKCVNCPEAAQLAKNLQLAHTNQIVLIGIHAGFFAVPDQSGLYTADYRCPEGTSLNDYFNIMQYPTGIVNRKAFEGKIRLLPTSWESAINAELQQDPVAFIQIENIYNPQNRNLQIKTDIKILQDLEGEYTYTLYLIENHLTSAQKNNNASVGPVPDIIDYIHNHVLRTSINGIWGETLLPINGFVKGENIQLVHNLVVSQEWNAAQCQVVAFISKSDNHEVIQAAEKSIE